MKKGIVLGIIIILLGIFLFVRDMGFISDCITFRVISWQSLLIALGIIFLVDKKFIVGSTLTIIGSCYLLLDSLKTTVNIINPIIFLVVGVIILVLSLRHKKINVVDCFGENNFLEIPIDGRKIFHKDYVFSGSKEKWTCDALRKNMRISIVFSNIELDLTQTELAEEETTIRVGSVFSKMTFYVPVNWEINVRQKGVFNELVDKRPQNDSHFCDRKKVFLEIEMIFSAGEIKCYR